MNMNIFVRLGGFHQFMSFLGSIGCLMEGSGLRTALENIYPITVGHMFSGKALLVQYVVICYVLQQFYRYSLKNVGIKKPMTSKVI